MRAKEWFKLVIGYGLAVVMAGVIIWAMLALYQPTFSAVNNASDDGNSPPLSTR